MQLLCLLIAIAGILLYIRWTKMPSESFTYADPSGWHFVGKLIEGEEYNRTEFNVDDAARCRKLCGQRDRCKATEYMHDHASNGDDHVCVFYEKFTGTIASQRMPTERTDGVWIKD